MDRKEAHHQLVTSFFSCNPHSVNTKFRIQEGVVQCGTQTVELRSLSKLCLDRKCILRVSIKFRITARQPITGRLDASAPANRRPAARDSGVWRHTTAERCCVVCLVAIRGTDAVRFFGYQKWCDFYIIIIICEVYWLSLSLRLSPGGIFPSCMLLIVMPFPPANQRAWRETRAEDEPSELCASTD